MTDSVLEQLQEDFEKFRDDCMELRNLHNVFVALYQTEPQRADLLHRTAQLFFANLNKFTDEVGNAIGIGALDYGT